MLLLPASVDDYVAADNPVRFIEAFVDDLDLGEDGFRRSQPSATGRSGYAPDDLLKLYLYGYLNRVWSHRRLAAEAGRNLEAMWLLRGLREVALFVWARTSGGGWHAIEGGEQSQAQLHA